MVIGNVSQPLLRRPQRAAVDYHKVIRAQMIEQRAQPVFKQRQPVLHPGQPTPIADRLIERIAGGICAELLAIAGAEAFDRIFIQQGLAGGQQQVLRNGAG